MKKIILIILGVISLIIGIVGLMLPIIPQIPFFLAACFLFAKTSKRFGKWFYNTKLYKKYLSKYVKKAD